MQTWKIQCGILHVCILNCNIDGIFSIVYRQYVETFPFIHTVNQENMNEIDKNDFWNWAHSDFLSNAQRGILAEYIVGMALNCLSKKRIEWDAYDLVTNSGIKVEVKSAAYLQSWKQNKLSEIRFDIGKKKSWYAETNAFNKTCERSADVYIFSVLSEKNRNQINPLNLRQWFFMVLPSKIINSKFGKQKTVGLAALEKLGVRRLAFEEIKAEIENG